MNHICRIAIVTNVNDYNEDMFPLCIERVGVFVLNKEIVDGSRNIYITSCHIPYQYIMFCHNNNPMSFAGSISEDADGNYNHCHDLCKNGILLPAPAETCYSIYSAIAPNYQMYRNAITFYMV